MPVMCDVCTTVLYIGEDGRRKDPEIQEFTRQKPVERQIRTVSGDGPQISKKFASDFPQRKERDRSACPQNLILNDVANFEISNSSRIEKILSCHQHDQHSTSSTALVPSLGSYLPYFSRTQQVFILSLNSCIASSVGNPVFSRDGLIFVCACFVEVW